MEDDEAYGIRPPTHVICKQLEAIDDHNQKCKKEKDKLPELSAPNIYVKTLTRRDPKKGKPIQVKKYFNIGAVDAPLGSGSFRNSASAFTISNMTKGIQN